MVEYLNGELPFDRLLNFCRQVEALEIQSYGEGNNRSSELLFELCRRNSASFLFAVDAEEVVGTADFWEVSRELYSGIMCDSIPEEHLPVDLIVGQDGDGPDSTGLWYLASFIIAPRYRSSVRGDSPVYRSIARRIWEGLRARSQAYPIKFLGVVSSESGRKMMEGWHMTTLETQTRKDRCEGLYQDPHQIDSILNKYAF